ncbi:MAG: LysM peptidoglycan-binding domain-containing protein [Pseudomonadota bacterium]
MLTFKRALVLLLAILIAGCNFQPVKQQTAEKLSTPPDVKYETLAKAKEIDETPTKQQQISVEQIAKLTPKQDVWLVIRDDLELDTHVDHVWVKSKLNWFAKNQEYMDRVSDRAHPYLYHIVSRLKERNMPLDLALLPIVESAYQPFAYSHAHASGIWQFISATGKRYGLKQNWWYDGRRDIVAATEAALDYLEMLHGRFNGNWLHALAAYNSGEGNVERAIRRNKRAKKPTDFWHLRLPRETRGYVPSLLAVAELLKNSSKYNILFKRIPNTPYFDQIDVGSQIDLATVAELSGLSMEEVYTLNPGFNRWATDPDGPHRILVPIERSSAFKQKLATIPSANRVQWTRHTIKEGESLGVIARKYKTSISAIKSANKLRSNLIRAGHSLLIPKSKLDDKAYTLSADARKFRGLKKTGDGTRYVYTVRRGDNLWDIGRHYGVSVKQMTQWNGISRKSILRPGQKLVVWVEDDEANENNIVKVANQSTDMDSYTVKSGDSLWLIARRFDIHVKDLVKWNNLNKKKPLQPGQTLIVRPAVSGA